MTKSKNQKIREEVSMALFEEKNHLICKRLADKRKETGLSLRDVSNMLGTPIKELQQIEAGETVISFKTAAQIAHVLGTTIGDLR